MQSESDELDEMVELLLELEDAIEKSEALFLVRYKDNNDKRIKKCPQRKEKL